MTDNSTHVSTPSRTLAALRELVRALDRRHRHIDRQSEAGIADAARLLRHQAVVRIEELQEKVPGKDRCEAELANAIMSDDGGPPGR